MQYFMSSLPAPKPETAQRVFWGLNWGLDGIKALAFYTASGSAYEPSERTGLST